MSDVAYGLHRRAFRKDRLPCQCMRVAVDGSIPAMLSTDIASSSVLQGVRPSRH